MHFGDYSKMMYLVCKLIKAKILTNRECNLVFGILIFLSLEDRAERPRQLDFSRVQGKRARNI